MLKKRTAKKCRRGKKLCANSECAAQIPIHTHICKLCGYINAPKRKSEALALGDVQKLLGGRAAKLNARHLSRLKTHFSRSLQKVFRFSSADDRQTITLFKANRRRSRAPRRRRGAKRRSNASRAARAIPKASLLTADRLITLRFRRFLFRK